jgi:hypothetical protein
VIINRRGFIFLVRKEHETGWGFSGGKVPPELKDSQDYEMLEKLAREIHAKNTGTDNRFLSSCNAKFEYIEESRRVRLVHFIYRSEYVWLSRPRNPARHPTCQFFSIEEVEQLASQKQLLPNVMKVIAFMREQKII